MENKSVSYRLHGEMDTTTVGLDEFVEKIHSLGKNVRLEDIRCRS